MVLQRTVDMSEQKNVTVTKVAEGVSGKKAAAAAKRSKAKKAETEVEGTKEEFDPMKWEGVSLVEEHYYYVVRSRDANPGITALDVIEDPVEVKEAEFLEYDSRNKEYAFDDGRLRRSREYLAVKVEDREEYIHEKNPAGKKAALAFAATWKARNQELIKAARHKDEKVCEEMATEAESLEELEVMAIALGGSPKTLLNAGKARSKKVQAILTLRTAWLERSKKPIPDRPSTKRLG